MLLNDVLDAVGRTFLQSNVNAAHGGSCGGGSGMQRQGAL